MMGGLRETSFRHLLPPLESRRIVKKTVVTVALGGGYFINPAPILGIVDGNCTVTCFQNQTQLCNYGQRQPGRSSCSLTMEDSSVLSKLPQGMAVLKNYIPAELLPKPQSVSLNTIMQTAFPYRQSKQHMEKFFHKNPTTDNVISQSKHSCSLAFSHLLSCVCKWLLSADNRLSFVPLTLLYLLPECACEARCV